MSRGTSEGTESENKEVKRGNKHFSEIQINKLTSRYNPAQNWCFARFCVKLPKCAFLPLWLLCCVFVCIVVQSDTA